ncbi:MAG: DUF1592 domain-containing protein [Alphaproteobacteria bacterium]|nr:DUF1592 domain-containing protein [Alphaproteobacteria bacterium]
MSPPLVVLLALAAGCAGTGDDSAAPVASRPSATPPSPALRRLTETQYHNAVVDLLGDGLVLPPSLEPDTTVDGLLSVGASVASVSSLGVQRYEDAAFLLAEQVVGDPARAAAVVGCDLDGAVDVDCAEAFVDAFGRRAFRRPLSDEERDRLVDLIVDVGDDAGDFGTGIELGLAAMLQSPWFLYRLEHGQPDADDPALRRLGGYELATRLSFLLWNTIPDEELLQAAEAGELDTDAGIRVQAERLLADERARTGLRNLFDELLALYELDDLSKDPTVYDHASSELYPAAKEETLRNVEAIVLDEDGDIRELLVTQRTFVDPRLAALYGIAAPTDVDEAGFGEVILPDDGGRRGLLGQASVLMINAHPARSSATRRGKFIRQRLLCQEMPAPPGDVDTSIPEADEDAPTLRDRIASHLEDPTCATCHELMDPIGLGMENFDGIGRWRLTENGATIDPTGELDGQAFSDAWQLGDTVAAHPAFLSCMTTQVYQYATGHVIDDGEEPLVDWLAEGLDLSGGSMQTMILALVTSDGFRTTGALDSDAAASSDTGASR